MAVVDILNTAKQFALSNDAALLTGVGITGTVTTAYLAGKGGFAAAVILEDQYAGESHAAGEPMIHSDFSLRYKVGHVWQEFIPAVGVGATTIGAIFMANRVSSKRAAALTAAYGVSERAFAEYKEKVVEKLGENKEAAIRAEVAQDRVDAKPVTVSTVIIGNGEVLCLENWGGRYFKSSVQAIEKARNEINHEMMNHSYSSLSEFFDKIGLPPTSGSDEVGWNINTPLELSLSTALSTDDQPCLVLDFAVAPVAGYGNLY